MASTGRHKGGYSNLSDGTIDVKNGQRAAAVTLRNEIWFSLILLTVNIETSIQKEEEYFPNKCLNFCPTSLHVLFLFLVGQFETCLQRQARL